MTMNRITYSLAICVAVSLVGCAEEPQMIPITPSDDDSNDEGATSETDPETEGTPNPEDAGTPMTLMKTCLDLIDDLEDGEVLITPVTEPSRQGAWFVYNDETVTATQTPAVGMPFAPEMPGGPSSDGIIAESLYAARTSGSGFAEWGAGMGFNLNNAGCAADPETGECPEGDDGISMPYDVSGFTGISFYSRYYGDLAGQTVAFKVVTTGVVPPERYGTCEVVTGGQCDAAYEATISIVSEWTAHEIPFTMLAQPSYAGANAVDFEPATVQALQWQVPMGTDFDFAIDEVCFY